MRRFSTGLLIGAVLLLAGCATPPAAPKAGELVATGRVAVKVPNDSQMANFTWRDDGQQAALDLGTPLGQTVARLTFTADSAKLQDSSGKETVAQSAEDLLQQRTGWNLPVQGMRWWLRGKPDPAVPAQVTVIPDGGVHIVQSGWQIDATDLRDAGVQGKLPYRVHASRDGLDLRIVVSDWQWQP
ncbi:MULTISPECIES: lipoprotein insertase outer membrane protein LolB [Silvimonas]|uniref:lipoprotein insertase outer membrane protein LolB n=1 Tax=Silvimonas TaxID=300264 RepID=UPI0024B35865|nr:MULTISPECIES: lipoprotein insertase outer membrane protein LolB [Silvimonas]MDR3427660.1 lipoprotein insertase outer membrane protein LolB [Silvimonas sp.]